MRSRDSKIKVTAIVPSAGSGRRFKSKAKKPFANLNQRPVLSYTLKALQASPLIRDIVLVIDNSLFKAARRLLKQYNITKVKKIVEGGKTRFDSVRQGLRFVDSDTSLVLIHDGVRPFVTEKIIKNTIIQASKFGASISAVPAKSTIKVSKKNPFVKSTLNRNNLWEVQTPQVFRKNLIEEAYKKIGRNKSFTDDATLMERMGNKVRIVRGDYSNIKITTIEDIMIAEALLRSKRQ